jgi:Receptor family ligand binding region
MSLRTKVSTFANSDAYGSSGIKQFQIRAATMGVQILSSSLFPVGLTNLADPISDALKSGSRIFLFFMSAIDMRNLLIQGTAA